MYIPIRLIGIWGQSRDVSEYDNAWSEGGDVVITDREEYHSWEGCSLSLSLSLSILENPLAVPVVGNRQDTKLGNPLSQSLSLVIIGLDCQSQQQRQAWSRHPQEDLVRIVETEVGRQLLWHRAVQHGGTGEDSSASPQVDQTNTAYRESNVVTINVFTRNVLAAASPYFLAMFTSGLIESEFDRTARGKLKHTQRVVLQGIQQPTLEVTNLDWIIITLSVSLKSPKSLSPYRLYFAVYIQNYINCVK